MSMLGRRERAARQDAAPRRRRDEAGVSLVEVIAASFILTITFVSLASVLIHSISTGHLSQQREAAASLASDVLENGRALGLTCLVAAAASATSSQTLAACPTVILTPATLPTGAPSLVQSTTFFSPTTLTLDATRYTITPKAPTGTAPSPVTLGVTVAWPGTTSFSATLTTALSQVVTTTLAVSALPGALASGTTLLVTSGTNQMAFVTGAAAAVGATSITVTSTTPTYAYPVGSGVAPAQTYTASAVVGY
jgi:hypothetical protein